MFTKTISYQDAFGNPRSERLHFHFTKKDIIDLEVMADKPISETLKAINAEMEAREFIRMVSDIVGAAYGERSKDGSKFLKNERIKEEFMSSEVFGELLFSLAANPEEAGEFFKALIPYDLLMDAKKEGKLSQEQIDMMEPFIMKENDIPQTPATEEVKTVDYDHLSHEELLALLKENNR